MRHGVKLNPLGRKKAHRKALMRNLTRQLIEHKRIVTTLAKAKALRVHVEPILTKSKKDTTHNRRIAFSYLQDKIAIQELFGPVSQKIANRPGGYTRIIKLDQRRGDNADMAMIELVDFNDVYDTSTEVGTKKKRTRRTRKKSNKAEAPAAETKEEAPAAAAETAEPTAEAATTEAPKAEAAPEVAEAKEPTKAEEPAADKKEGDDAEEKEA